MSSSAASLMYTKDLVLENKTLLFSFSLRIALFHISLWGHDPGEYVTDNNRAHS